MIRTQYKLNMDLLSTYFWVEDKDLKSPEARSPGPARSPGLATRRQTGPPGEHGPKARGRGPPLHRRRRVEREALEP